jgi:hypothetical protein
MQLLTRQLLTHNGFTGQTARSNLHLMLSARTPCLLEAIAGGTLQSSTLAPMARRHPRTQGLTFPTTLVSIRMKSQLAAARAGARRGQFAIHSIWVQHRRRPDRDSFVSSRVYIVSARRRCSGPGSGLVWPRYHAPLLPSCTRDAGCDAWGWLCRRSGC